MVTLFGDTLYKLIDRPMDDVWSYHSM